MMLLLYLSSGIPDTNGTGGSPLLFLKHSFRSKHKVFGGSRKEKKNIRSILLNARANAICTPCVTPIAQGTKMLAMPTYARNAMVLGGENKDKTQMLDKIENTGE